MNVLAFDTSSIACLVSLQTPTHLWTKSHQQPMQQGRLILPTIDELLSNAGLTINEIDTIVYGAGPGSFTGIRIASAVAQGLAFANSKCRVYAISSLALLAQTAYLQHGWTNLCVNVDARMKHYYVGYYFLNAQGIMTATCPDAALAAEALQLSASDLYGIGNGWLNFDETLTSQLLGLDINLIPSADALAQLAQAIINASEPLSAPNYALPAYLR